MTGKVLCVGAAVLDTLYRVEALPTGDGKLIAHDMLQIAEGMASSAACAVARLGGSASLWSAVGDDADGARIRAQLTEAGLDLSGTRTVPGARSAQSTILIDPKGERLIVVFYDPNLHRAPRPITDAEIADFNAVLADVRWPDLAAEVLRRARRRGIPAILDGDVAPDATLQRLAVEASEIVFSEPAAITFSGLATAPQTSTPTAQSDISLITRPVDAPSSSPDAAIGAARHAVPEAMLYAVPREASLTAAAESQADLIDAPQVVSPAQAQVAPSAAPQSSEIGSLLQAAPPLPRTAPPPPEPILRAIAERLGHERFCVTFGASGCFWLEGNRLRHQPALKVEAIDTLAAGDAFHGAFALARAMGESFESAIRLGTVTAALKCTVFGGRKGMPTKAEAQAALSQLAPAD